MCVCVCLTNTHTHTHIHTHTHTHTHTSLSFLPSFLPTRGGVSNKLYLYFFLRLLNSWTGKLVFVTRPLSLRASWDTGPSTYLFSPLSLSPTPTSLRYLSVWLSLSLFPVLRIYTFIHVSITISIWSGSNVLSFFSTLRLLLLFYCCYSFTNLFNNSA